MRFKKKQTSTIWFDGCEICNFMKEVEVGKKSYTEEELKKAFKRQAEKNLQSRKI